MADQPEPYMQEKQPFPPPAYPQSAGQPQGYPPMGQQYGSPQPGQPPMGQQYGSPQPGQPPMGQQYGSPHPGQPYNTNTVIVQQPTTLVQSVQIKFGPSPMAMKCPSCNAGINTKTTNKIGMMIWLASGIICFVGCFILGLTWFGCCLIPFCIPDLYDVEHSCPNCNVNVGYYRRLS